MIEATVGFAADAQGMGVAYVSARRAKGSLLLRLPFKVQRFPALEDREVAYAAMTVAARALREHGVRRVSFDLADPELVADVLERRQVPPAITLPYVRLGCALNQFTEYHLTAHAGDDLTARARAEVALSVAA
jgi:hypothetical protein